MLISYARDDSAYECTVYEYSFPEWNELDNLFLFATHFLGKEQFGGILSYNLHP